MCSAGTLGDFLPAATGCGYEQCPYTCHHNASHSTAVSLGPHNAVLQIHDFSVTSWSLYIRPQQVACPLGLHFNPGSAITQENLCPDSHVGQRREGEKRSGTSSIATLISQVQIWASRLLGASLGAWGWGRGSGGKETGLLSMHEAVDSNPSSISTRHGDSSCN